MSIKKYKKGPIVIEAVKWNGRLESIYGWIPRDLFEVLHNGDVVIIKTLEGHIIARRGDFIIKGIKGEFYPCEQDIFKKTYEEVK